MSLTHVLTTLDAEGPLGLHTIDNLIIVHSQSKSRSKLYDIMLTNQNTAAGELGNQSSVLRIASCLPPSVLVSTYSPHWVVFLPNVLVDARNGKMMTVTMKLSPSTLPTMSEDTAMTQARLLLNREHGKVSLVSLLRSLVTRRMCLATIGGVLGCVVSAYQCHTHCHDATPTTVTCSSVLGGHTRDITWSHPPAVVLDQPDIFTSVLNAANADGQSNIHSVMS